MALQITVVFGPMQLSSDSDCTFLPTLRTWYVLLPKTIILHLYTAATAWYFFITCTLKLSQYCRSLLSGLLFHLDHYENIRL